MLQAIQATLSANTGNDPYFRVLNDLISLMPWWYPYFWLGILGALVAYRLGRWIRTRLLTRRGISRVKHRLARAETLETRDFRAMQLHRMSANDNFVAGSDTETNAS